MMLFGQLFVGSLLLCALVQAAPTHLDDTIEQLAKKFAPVFWLHSEEIYFPSSVEYHLQHCNLQDLEEKILEEQVTIENIITGNGSDTLHLNSKTPLPSPQSGDLPFFKGQPLNEVPVYTLVRIMETEPLELEIYYKLFFPYNRGKDVCEGILTEDGNCIGRMDSFGHHVGDWEGISVHIKDGMLSEVYIGVHSFGAYYSWDEKEYSLYYGKDTGTSLIPFDCVDPAYPASATVQQNTPMAFVANGSHGMWADAGRHDYCKIINLYDETDEGIKFESKDNIKLYIWRNEVRPEGEWRWLNYLGKYGNLEQGCELEFISGECNLNNGPSGPSAPPDRFPAPVNITASTNVGQFE